MTISKRLTLITIVAAAMMIMPYCTPDTNESGTTTTPTTTEVVTDPDAPAQSCVLTTNEFASWFSSGGVTPNGFVPSANSLGTFTDNCDFYKWSWQMFLWHFSPKANSYVYDTRPFYDLEGQDLVFDGGVGISKRKKRLRPRGGKVDQEGQAGIVSGVLMSQQAGITPDGSIVFYAVHVNDVYAYMVSGQKTGKLDLKEFPTTQAQLDEIEAYAKNVHNVVIEDGESLAMELKSSWIKLPAGADNSRYATITADVPLYNKISDKEWEWDGTTYENNVTLAMVGYHLVGSAAGHPEMIWATFEHVDNLPNVDYFYVDGEGNVKEKKTFGTDNTPIRKDWVFTNDSTKLNASNQMHMELEGNKIIAETPNNISPSSTIRTHPWGNIADTTSAVNNTEIISLNENITSMLMNGDVRKNYFLVGATWTANGVPGVGEQIPVVKGSKILANATMETYFQYKNCFDCHQGGNISGLSHIFDEINPLPIPGSN
ncbi:MAG: hypothetical protein ACI8X3_001636 [Saprospiraceae bacterium]|jgi:hypothetical protein